MRLIVALTVLVAACNGDVTPGERDESLGHESSQCHAYADELTHLARELTSIFEKMETTSNEVEEKTLPTDAGREVFERAAEFVAALQAKLTNLGEPLPAFHRTTQRFADVLGFAKDVANVGASAFDFGIEMLGRRLGDYGTLATSLMRDIERAKLRCPADMVA